MSETNDPRELGGDIAGPGGPHDQDGVVIDTRKSVLLDGANVAMLSNPSDRCRLAAVQLSGRVNQSPDRTRVLYIMDAGGLAALVAEMVGLAGREGGEFAAQFEDALAQRMEELP